MSSYLGVPPQSGFITTAKQRITSSTNNYVDLDHSISSLADVIVFVNFVKQDYTNLTLTTSSRITLGGTLVASDIVEIAYLGKAVATQTPSSGTVTNDMLAGSIANSKLANSSITLNGSAVSLGGSATIGSDAGTNAFSAYNNNGHAVANDSYVKVQFNAEFYDPSSVYDHSSNYRFTVPSGGAGRYHFNSYIRIQGFNEEFRIVPYKNNAQYGYYNTKFSTTGQSFSFGIAFELQLAESDYIEIYCWHNGGTKSVQGDGTTPLLTTFSGFRIS